MADAEEEAPSGIGERVREVGLALVYLTRGAGPTLDLAAVARGGAFFPVLGLLLGGVAVLVLLALPPTAGPRVTGAAGVLLLVVLCGATLQRGFAGAVAVLLSPASSIAKGPVPAGARAAGVVAALASTGVKWWALGVTPPEALSLSLPLAAMLGRWAFVVEAYGSRSARAEGVGAVFPKAMQFREFGIASVSAMALTLVLANAIGLVLILWTATQTILVRVVAHRRAGGVGERSLLAGAELAETSTLLLCAGLARAILSG